MAVVVDVEDVAISLSQPPAHSHRLGGSCWLIEEGGVRYFESGEVRNHGLEVEQRFEPPLRYLRLVWRVRRVPGWIL